jgi:hypothetical protein
MDLDRLANIAEIFGVLLVVGGFGFAIVQLAAIRRQRKEIAAIELLKSFESPEFTRAIRLLLTLPENATAEQLRSAGDDVEDAAMQVSLTLEGVAIMVHRRIVDIDMVWELMGGLVLAVWARIGLLAEAIRKDHKRDKFCEWLQWLAARLMDVEKERGSQPAFARYRDWRP